MRSISCGEGLQLIRKQRLIANAIVLTLNDAIFIKTNVKTKNLKLKKVDAGGKNDAHGDDKIMFLLRGVN